MFTLGLTVDKLLEGYRPSRRADWLTAFTQELEAYLPPAKGRHHKIRFAEYGSDETGWKPKLCLELHLPSGQENFFLSNEDLRGKPRNAARRVGLNMVLELRGPINATS